MRTVQVNEFFITFAGEINEEPRDKPERDSGRSIQEHSEAIPWVDLISCLQGMISWHTVVLSHNFYAVKN